MSENDVKNENGYDPAQMEAAFTLNGNVDMTQETAPAENNTPETQGAPAAQEIPAAENAPAPENSTDNTASPAETEKKQTKSRAKSAAKPKTGKASAKKTAKDAVPQPADTNGTFHAMAIDKAGAVVVSGVSRIPEEGLIAVVCHYDKAVGFDCTDEVYAVNSNEEAKELIIMLCQAWQSDMQKMGRAGIIYYTPDGQCGKVVDDNDPTCVSEFKTAALMKGLILEKQITSAPAALAKYMPQTATAEKPAVANTVQTQPAQSAPVMQSPAESTPVKENPQLKTAMPSQTDMQNAQPAPIQAQPAAQPAAQPVQTAGAAPAQTVQTQPEAKETAPTQPAPAVMQNAAADPVPTQTVPMPAPAAASAPTKTEEEMKKDRLVEYLMNNAIMGAQFLQKTQNDIAYMDKQMLDAAFRLQIDRTQPAIIEQWYAIALK